MDDNFIVVSDDELYHHGVMGMKWGVRRYQNYDGTYTKRGLDRFRKSESKYDKANEKLHTAKTIRKQDKKAVSRKQIRDYKRKVKAAKKEMSASYDQLKLDKMADEGKKLYKSGKTITENQNATRFRRKTIALSNVAAQVYLDHKKATPTTKMTVASIAIGLEAVNELYNFKVQSDNRKIRAYYAH